MTKAIPPPFAPDPPCRPGEGEVGDLGLVTGRAHPGLRQQHDVEVVVLNESGYIGPLPGRQGMCFRLKKNYGKCEAVVCEGDAAER